MSLLRLSATANCLNDNYLNANSTSQNNGSQTNIRVSYVSGVKNVSLLRFLIPSTVTKDNFIESRLVLKQVGWEGIGDPPIETVNIKTGYLNNTGWTEAGSTWLISRGGTSWTNSGAYQSPDVISGTISTQSIEHDGTYIAQEISIDTTTIVNYGLNTAQSYTLSMSLWTETETTWNYGSKESQYIPYMIFFYSAERKNNRLGKSKVARIPSL
jgi:hypothetical protein